MTKRPWATLGFLMLAATQVGCDDDCLDEKETMQAFLTDASHLTCKGTEDCVVVSTGCVPVERGLCGQAALNQTAAASTEWKRIQAASHDCMGGSCAQCAAGLINQCHEGFCGGAP